MKILQICPRSPVPPADGGAIAMVAMTRGLRAAGASVDVMSLNLPTMHVDHGEAARMMAPAPLEMHDLRSLRLRQRPWRWATSLRPLLVEQFYSARFEQTLMRRVLEGAYDVVHFEGQFLLPYMKQLRRASPRVFVSLRAQNVEYQVWKRLAQHEEGLRRLLLSALAWDLRRYESPVPPCDVVVPITADDATTLRECGWTQPMHVAPCGLELASYIPRDDGDSDVIAFIGALSYRPNEQGLLWFVREVWPRLKARRPSLRLVAAGRQPRPRLVAELANAGVELRPDIDDAVGFIASAGVFIVPLLSGGGMRVKILEALAMRKAVVATSIAAEGIALRDGVDALIANDPASFAAAVERCVEDASLRRSLGASGRALVESFYDERVVGSSLLRFYRSAVEARA